MSEGSSRQVERNDPIEIRAAQPTKLEDASTRAGRRAPRPGETSAVPDRSAPSGERRLHGATLAMVVINLDRVAAPARAATTALEKRTLPLPIMIARILAGVFEESLFGQRPEPRVVLMQSVSDSSTRVYVHSFVRVAVSVTLKSACFCSAAYAEVPAEARRHARSVQTPSRRRRIRFIVSATPRRWEVSVRPLR